MIFIINPSSGGKGATRILEQLRRLDSEIDYFVSHTKEAFDRFVESNIDQYKVFVIYRGDGTINTTLKYLADYDDKILAVLPNGSGDGFAKELGFKNDLKTLLNKIQQGQTKNVDLAKINNGYSCNMIGLGLDSYIASDFEKSKKRGLLNYILATIKSLFSFKKISAKIEIDNRTISGEYLMINIANTRQLGNNFFIAPDAKFDDGLLDLALIKLLPF